MKKLLTVSGLVFFIVAGLVIHSCKKDQPKIPVVSTTEITEISQISAITGGKLTDEGSAAIVSVGVCWGTSEEPTIADNKTIETSGLGQYISKLTLLTANTNYYVRAYAMSNAGIGYGDQVSFTTSKVAVPVLVTSDITLITAVSAVSGGNITTDNGEAVTARGVCYNTVANPTITNSKTTMCPGNGPFTCSVPGLTPGTTYYLRAYATNSVGTSYGNELSFKTLATLPTISSVFASSITQTTAVSGGNITSDGGAAVTKRGVCWNRTGNSSISDNKTEDGTGNGVFSSTITGLSPSTNYYVRAYATNSVGTTYGNDLSFTTSAPIPPSVTTATITSVQETTAVGGGNVTGSGGVPVTARGVCWSITANPTITNSKTTDGNGTGAFTSSITGLQAGTTYYARAYATNSAGTSYGFQQSFTTMMAPPTNGLVGYWPFTGNANDESGNGHNGIVNGASLTTDRFGNINSAYYFDGINNYIAIAPSSLVDNETSITVSCWLKREVMDADGLPIHTGNQGRFGILVKKDSVVVAVTTDSNFDGSAPSEFDTKWVKYNQTEWSHIVLKYDATKIMLYINGVLRSSNFAEGKIWTAQPSYLAFGVYYLFGSPHHGYYKGILDDVRLYNRALSDQEIQALYLSH